MIRAFDFSFIDFDKMVEDWAWEEFLGNQTGVHRRIKRKNLSMKISWDRVTFTHSDVIFDKPTVRDPLKVQTLFVTTFTNKTKRVQEYRLNVARSTKTDASVFIKSGFTIGDDVGIKFSAPQTALEANVGFKKEIRLTKDQLNMFEHEIEWGVDSQINVDPMSSTMAEVKIKMKAILHEFSVLSKLQGIVQVTFLNKKKNNTFVKQIEGDIRVIFDEKLRDVPNVELMDDRLDITTMGTCFFRFGYEQVVSLTRYSL